MCSSETPNHPPNIFTFPSLNSCFPISPKIFAFDVLWEIPLNILGQTGKSTSTNPSTFLSITHPPTSQSPSQYSALLGLHTSHKNKASERFSSLAFP